MIFRGEIAGAGSSSGVRVVIGRWRESPFGAFADAMVETPAGHRVLIAPTEQVAEFVSGTYTFDERRVEPFEVIATPDLWQVRSESLTLDVALGPSTALGRLLSVIPRSVAESRTWCALTDPVARVLLRGVRTKGSAGHGRREFYGAHGVRAVIALSGAFDGQPLGCLAPVDPPCTFGFSSTPRRPSVTEVTTTIDLPPAAG